MQIYSCLHVRIETVKLLGENLGVNLQNFEFDNNYLDMVPNAQAIKE